jgi:hypothetical protein
MRKPKPLQKFGYQDSPYERPNQKWVCGKQAQGCPCQIGPDNNGHCRAEYQCQPQKKADRWYCTRSTVFGGACSNGPLPNGTCCQSITPCSPIRSIRHKRTVTIKWLCALTLGLLLFFIDSDNKQQFLSPGDLTYQHAQISKCSTCHKVFDRGISGWIHQALNASSILDTNQQCLSCHQFGEHAAEAHSLPKAELMTVAHVVDADTNRPQYQKIACMTCHVEHHGSNASLLTVNSQNCASCHDLPLKFGRKTHPEFRHYPYRRRTGIIFDHNQHYDKHFYDKQGTNLRDNAPDSCLSCHISDQNGIKMIVRNYKINCAECHNNLFEESEYFAVFAVPALDVDNINSLGTWPEDTDAELTPFMKLLLSDNEQLHPLLSELESDDLTELEEKSAQAIAWGIKEIFYDIYLNGKTAIAKRLANVYHCQLNTQGNLIQEPACKLNASELKSLVATFPLSLFCSAQQKWFPRLSSEVSVYQNFQGIRKSAKSSNPPACEKSTKDSKIVSDGWSLDDFTLSYRPAFHADDFFTAWLEATRRHQGDKPTVQIRKEIFNLLTSKDDAGQCNYCHSMDSDMPENYYINWTVAQWSPKLKDFIHFNHASHLLRQKESVCLECHKANKKADYLASYDQYQPLKFQSNFSTDKQVCETCHIEAMTNNQCQTCHNYHVHGLAGNPLHPYKDQLGSGQLKIWAEKTEYQIGDSIVIKFSVNQPMYVRIIRIDSSGKLLSLFPNEFRLENFCKPGIIYHIPDIGSQRRLKIVAPAGTDMLFGIGSAKPIPEDALFFNRQNNFDEHRMSKFLIRSTFEIHVQEKR